MSATASSVVFATSAWERDWRVVLDPRRMASQVSASRHTFAKRLIVLNNFATDASRLAASRQARRLVANGLADAWIDALDYLKDDVLSGFGLDPKRFWQANPYFATSHLALLHWARRHGDHVFFVNGDVWFQSEHAWVDRALAALGAEPKVRGLNLCRNVYLSTYDGDSDRQTADLWISPGVTTQAERKQLEAGPSGYGVPASAGPAPDAGASQAGTATNEGTAPTHVSVAEQCSALPSASAGQAGPSGYGVPASAGPASDAGASQAAQTGPTISRVSAAEQCSALPSQSLPAQTSLPSGPRRARSLTGFTLSDHAYLLPTNPPGGWNFAHDEADLDLFRFNWPPYATPCFEMLYAIAMRKQGFEHGALKPDAAGGPVTKHKSFPKGAALKFLFYRTLGYYRPGGRYATPSS